MAFLWGSIRWIVAITIVCWAVFIIFKPIAPWRHILPELSSDSAPVGDN